MERRGTWISSATLTHLLDGQLEEERAGLRPNLERVFEPLGLRESARRSDRWERSGGSWGETPPRPRTRDRTQGSGPRTRKSKLGDRALAFLTRNATRSTHNEKSASLAFPLQQRVGATTSAWCWRRPRRRRESSRRRRRLHHYRPHTSLVMPPSSAARPVLTQRSYPCEGTRCGTYRSADPWACSRP